MGQQTPHDRFFHDVLSNKDNVVDFLQGVLPNDLVHHLDLQNIAKDNIKYTDEQLDEYFSDIVYTCRCTASYSTGYTEAGIKLALLFEHKSFVPAFPHTQLLRYILNIWGRGNGRSDRFVIIYRAGKPISQSLIDLSRSSTIC